MKRISITHSPDGLTASALVTQTADGTYPSVEELREALRAHGVVFGLDEAALNDMVMRKVYTVLVAVAHGTPSQPGADANLELMIDISAQGKPRQRTDGSVDHRDLQFAVNTRKGTSLQKRIPPVPGIDGMDVFGHPIKASAPLDIKFKAGVGTVVSATNPNLLVAAEDGAVSVLPDGRIEVRSERTIQGDVDYSTGNVRFNGNLTVNGTVRSGFEVFTEGDLVVAGHVEESVVTCRGMLDIKGGVVSTGKGKLTSGGGIKLRHMENFSAESEGDIIATEDIINCKLSARGSIIARSLVGGIICAGKMIDTESIGNAAEIKTILDAGGQAEMLRQKDLSLKALAHIVTETGLAKEMMYTIVRDKMNEQGVLDQASESRLRVLALKRQGFATQSRELEQAIEDLNRKLTDFVPPVFKTRALFPNVVLRYGTQEKLIREQMTDVTIRFDREEILISKG